MLYSSSDYSRKRTQFGLRRPPNTKASKPTTVLVRSKHWLPPLKRAEKNRVNRILILNLAKYRANQILLAKLQAVIKGEIKAG
jgi:hypothetical protein